MTFPEAAGSPEAVPSSQAGSLPAERSHGTPSVRLTRPTVLTALLLAAVFTVLCLQWSLTHGRLSQDPTYDDCAYLYDGGKRLLILYDQGFGAFLVDAVKDPPHAPFSAFGATLAFLLFGLRDWAPYALNGLIVFGLLLLVGYIARNLSLRWRTALMVLALTVPVAIGAVHDYRPDALCALFTAAGAYLVTEAGIDWTSRAQRRTLIAGGVAFGLALWAKPAVFPLTVLVTLLSTGGAWLATVFFDPPGSFRRAPGLALRVAAAVVLPCAVVAAPYYAVNGVAVVRYFIQNSFGQDNQFTKLPGGFASSAQFYTVGPAGEMLLGKGFLAWLCLYGVILCGLGWRRHHRELALQALLLALTFVTLGAVVYGRINNPYFGLTWVMLLVVACVRAGAFALSTLRLDRWPAIPVAALLAALTISDLLFLPLNKVWPNHHPAVDELVGRGHSINQRILDDIGREIASHPGQAGQRWTTFLTVTGFINEATLRWLACQEGRPLLFYDLQRATGIEPFRQAIASADFIVSGEDQTGGVFEMMPPWKLRFQLADLCTAEESAGRLRLLASYPTSAGGAYHLWVNEALNGQASGVFSSFSGWEGFMPFEGPYPQWHEGQVRWAIGRRSQFTFDAAAAGAANLDMWVRAPSPVHASILLDGNPAGEMDVPVEPSFRHIIVPVTLRAGANRFTLAFADDPPAAADGYRRSILFSQLEVQPAP